MTERHQLYAYLATLAALVVVFVAALLAAAFSPGLIGRFETFGLGTITGGLIGVLRIPSSRAPTTNVEQAGTVNSPGAPATPVDAPPSADPAA